MLRHDLSKSFIFEFLITSQVTKYNLKKFREYKLNSIIVLVSKLINIYNFIKYLVIVF